MGLSAAARRGRRRAGVPVPARASAVPRGEIRRNTLAPDEIFVLGDNRDNSFDSRHFGAVRSETIVGRPLVVFLSFADGRMSWSRIGLEL